MFSKNLISKTLLIGISLFASFCVNASLTTVGNLIQVSVNITEYKNNGDIKNINDCSGYFGSGFTNCEITHVPTPNSEIFETVMSKYDAENSADNEFILGSTSLTDWSFSNSLNGATEGDWTYSGSLYPGISFWVSKGGNEGFILNWMVSQDNANNFCNNGDEFSVNCLSVAIAVNSGHWAAPEPHNISHITFYGNKCDNNCGPAVTQKVPEPTSIALFALALFGIAARRKKFTS